MMKRIFLVLSGQVCRENSLNLKAFWQGFYNIQRSLSAQQPYELAVVGHSWTPETDAVVASVYNCVGYASSTQHSFLPQALDAGVNLLQYEAGLRRDRSTWKRVSLQSVLGNATSRSEAFRVLAGTDIRECETVIAARWDQGCSGSPAVNIINHDLGLPDDYIYLPYYSEIDEGYGDMWCVAPYHRLRKFAGYGDFVLQSLAGKNNYFRDFVETGWPMALPKQTTFWQQKTTAIASRCTAVLNKSPLRTTRIGRSLKIRLDRAASQPIFAGENTLQLGEHAKHTYKSYQALNNHALLKYFFLKQGLRAHTRFLQLDDCANIAKGRLINPMPYAMVVYSHSSYSDCWSMVISQAKKNLSDPCAKIYLFAENSDKSVVDFKALGCDDVELITYDDELLYTKRIAQCLAKLDRQHQFIYFIHEDMPLFAKVDEFYLNTLLHYMQNSRNDYIKLVDTTAVNQKTAAEDCFGLVDNIGGYALSVQPSIYKRNFMFSLFNNLDLNIYDFERYMEKCNFACKAVAGNRKVGKSLLANDYFPHVATAIFKGKWCMSEWAQELDDLLAAYNIPVTVRGEC